MTRRAAWTPEKVRLRIRTGVLMQRLSDHALGTLEMSATQIKAAEILLRKCIPDLRAVEHSGELVHRHTTEMSDAELAHIAARSGQGAIEATPSETDASGVH